MQILSALFSRLVEDGKAQKNPALSLPKSVRRLMRPTHDPRTTPFLERADDIRRVYLALPPPLNTAFSIGALAGLRTGEVFALRWQHVDLAARRIHWMRGPRHHPVDLAPSQAEAVAIGETSARSPADPLPTSRDGSGNTGAAS